MMPVLAFVWKKKGECLMLHPSNSKHGEAYAKKKQKVVFKHRKLMIHCIILLEF
jgi:hypothetical protein